MKAMFGSSLPPVVYRGAHVFIYIICVCLRIVVSNIYCVVLCFVVFVLCFSSSCVPLCCQFLWIVFVLFFFVLRTPMLSVSMDCPFLIASSVFSVYLLIFTKNNAICWYIFQLYFSNKNVDKKRVIVKRKVRCQGIDGKLKH